MSSSQADLGKEGRSDSKVSPEQHIIGTAVINEGVQRPFELVPPIGTRWRWYDPPYRSLHWLLKLLPSGMLFSAIRRFLVDIINLLLVVDQHERNKAVDSEVPDENVFPEQTRLRQGGLWTVEIFPPSKYRNLTRSLRQNGWKHSQFRSMDESNIETVRRARDGVGYSWWRILSVASRDTTVLLPDARREDLPREFEYIELTAVQLGTGVTAVVAFFQFSKNGESCLNDVWCQKHEPKLVWRWMRRPNAIDRSFAAIEATQSERLRLHNLARRWMSKKCPGFFASRSDSHPVIDLNLFDGVDPTEENKSISDGLKALGLERVRFDRFVSPDFAGTILIPTEGPSGPHEPLRNCWGIAGEYSSVVDENERDGYGDKPYTPRAISHMFDDAARSFVLYLAIMRYLQEQRAVYSAARDLAAIRHRKFTIRRVRNLSEELLESGLDLPAMARDSRRLWSKRWRTWHGLKVVSSPTKTSKREEFDLIKSFEEESAFQFKELLEEGENYRTVLSTAAALGSSTESAKIGRRALFVAGCSVLVAVATLLTTDLSNTSIWSAFVAWVQQRSSSWWLYFSGLL